MNKSAAFRYLILKHLSLAGEATPRQKLKTIACSLKVERQNGEYLIRWGDGTQDFSKSISVDAVSFYRPGDRPGFSAGANGVEAATESTTRKLALEMLGGDYPEESTTPWTVCAHAAKTTVLAVLFSVFLWLSGSVTPAVAAVIGLSFIPERLHFTGKVMWPLAPLSLALSGYPLAASTWTIGLLLLTVVDPYRGMIFVRIISLITAIVVAIYMIQQWPTEIVLTHLLIFVAVAVVLGISLSVGHHHYYYRISLIFLALGLGLTDLFVGAAFVLGISLFVGQYDSGGRN